MLFPLSKDFSSSSIFQKSGEHHPAPIHRVWSIDHTGSAERTKELHLLLTDKKPYKCHEQLATKRAQDGQRQDAARMNGWRADLKDMYENLDAEANSRRQEMYAGMRSFKKRNAASDSDLRNRLRNQALDHRSFLNEMDQRVNEMPPVWVCEPPRETRERTRARSETAKGVVQATKDYKQMIASLKGELDVRGDQEWTAKPKPSNDTIVKQRKAKGLAAMTAAKCDYEAMMEGMEEREKDRCLGERRELQRQAREGDLRLSADKTKLLTLMNEQNAGKKAELDGIQARVNGRGSGHPAHPEFQGYACAGYQPVVKSNSRLRDHAAEAQDRDANHEESAAKLLCLSMPLPTRNRIVANNPPKLAASLIGTSIDKPTDWSGMNWTQRWSLLSRHGSAAAVQKAQQKAGVDSQGMDMSATMSPADQRTLSPRALGLASTC